MRWKLEISRILFVARDCIEIGGEKFLLATRSCLGFSSTEKETPGLQGFSRPWLTFWFLIALKHPRASLKRRETMQERNGRTLSNWQTLRIELSISEGQRLKLKKRKGYSRLIWRKVSPTVFVVSFWTSSPSSWWFLRRVSVYVYSDRILCLYHSQAPIGRPNKPKNKLNFEFSNLILFST